MPPELIKLLEYLKKEKQHESKLLYPDATWYVFLYPLLDEIAKIYNIPKEDIGKIMND